MQHLGWVRVGVFVGLFSLSACARLGADRTVAPGGTDGGLLSDTAAVDVPAAVPPADAAPDVAGFFPTNVQTGGASGWSGVGLASSETEQKGAVHLALEPRAAIKPTKLPVALAWASAAPSGPNVVLVGGGTKIDDSQQSLDVLSYNPLAETIGVIADLPLGLSQGAAVGLPSGIVYSIKGKDTGFTLEGNLFRINVAAGSIVKTTATMEKSFRHTAALGLDGLIYVLGGVGSGPIVNKIEAYDPVNDAMIALSVAFDPDPKQPGAIVGREHARAITAANGIIYIFGGALGRADDGAAPTDSTGISADILALDPKAPALTKVASLPLPLMNVALGNLPDGRILIVGGDAPTTTPNQSAPSAKIFVYDPTKPAAAPTTMAISLPYPLSGAAAAMAPNGKLYLLGGVTPAGLSDAILELLPYTKVGQVVGAVVDLGASGQRWQQLAWTAELPPGTSLQAFVRAAETKFDPAADTPAWQTAGLEAPIKTLPAGRFVQWRFELTTTNTALTPALLDVTCSYLKTTPP